MLASKSKGVSVRRTHARRSMYAACWRHAPTAQDSPAGAAVDGGGEGGSVHVSHHGPAHQIGEAHTLLAGELGGGAGEGELVRKHVTAAGLRLGAGRSGQ